MKTRAHHRRRLCHPPGLFLLEPHASEMTRRSTCMPPENERHRPRQLALQPTRKRGLTPYRWNWKPRTVSSRDLGRVLQGKGPDANAPRHGARDARFRRAAGDTLHQPRCCIERLFYIPDWGYPASAPWNISRLSRCASRGLIRSSASRTPVDFDIPSGRARGCEW